MVSVPHGMSRASDRSRDGRENRKRRLTLACYESARRTPKATAADEYAGRRLKGITRSSSALRLCAFLENYLDILAVATGHIGWNARVITNVRSPDREWPKLLGDFAVYDFDSTRVGFDNLILFGTNESLINHEGSASDDLYTLTDLVTEHIHIRDGRQTHRFHVVSGRRMGRAVKQKASIGAFNEKNRDIGLMLRSYDWLLDASVKAWGLKTSKLSSFRK
jgi:hypothetical protein